MSFESTNDYNFTKLQFSAIPSHILLLKNTTRARGEFSIHEVNSHAVLY